MQRQPSLVVGIHPSTNHHHRTSCWVTVQRRRDSTFDSTHRHTFVLECSCRRDIIFTLHPQQQQKQQHTTVTMMRDLREQEQQQDSSMGLYEQCFSVLGQGASADDMLQCFSNQLLLSQQQSSSSSSSSSSMNPASSAVTDAFAREVLLVLA